MRHASGRRGVEGPGLEDPAAELWVAEEVLVGAGGEGWVARDQRPRWRVGRVVLGEARRQVTDHDVVVGHATTSLDLLLNFGPQDLQETLNMHRPRGDDALDLAGAHLHPNPLQHLRRQHFPVGLLLA